MQRVKINGLILDWYIFGKFGVGYSNIYQPTDEVDPTNSEFV